MLLLHTSCQIAGIQQHPHGGSVFYVTGTAKQELFNTAEKTKESIVDDINNCNLKSLNLSPPDTSPDSFHEVPVDCPEEVPVDVSLDKIHRKVVCIRKRKKQFNVTSLTLNYLPWKNW